MSVPPTIVTNCSSRLDRGAYRARLSEPSPAKVDGGDNMQSREVAMLRLLVVFACLVQFSAVALAHRCPSGTIKVVRDGWAVCLPLLRPGRIPRVYP